MFEDDTLTPYGLEKAEEIVSEQKKADAQKRLDEDTRRVGYQRGELFKNKDGGWSINWGGKYPL